MKQKFIMLCDGEQLSGQDVVPEPTNKFWLQYYCLHHPCLVACWCLIAPTVNSVEGKNTLVLMHNGIVNRYQLLWDAHTMPEQHWNCRFISILLTIILFRFTFCVFVTLTVLFLFFGPTKVCVKILKSKEGSRFSFVIPWPLSVNTLGTKMTL